MNNEEKEYLVHHLEMLFKVSTLWYKFGMQSWWPKQADKVPGYLHARRVIHQELELRR